MSAPWTQLQSDFLKTLDGRGPFEIRPGPIVVIPSLTLAAEELQELIGMPFYEERLLFVLLLMMDPTVQIVYVTSEPIDNDIIDYYLNLIPEQPNARRTAVFISLNDPDPQPLTYKLLKDHRATTNILRAIAGTSSSFMLPFIVTAAEEHLAEQLRIPIYGSPSTVAYLGTKSGGRAIARVAGVPVLNGVEAVRTSFDIERAVDAVCRGSADRAVVKINDAFSGLGNAIVSRTNSAGAVRIARQLWAIPPDGVGSWATYERRLLARGGVIEALLDPAMPFN